MKRLLTLTLAIISSLVTLAQKPAHCSAVNGDIESTGGEITLTAHHNESYSWCCLSPETLGLELARARSIVAKVTNRGVCSVDLLLWAVGDEGWNSAAGKASIASGESATISCNLRATHPDGTPRLDPNRLSHLDVMITKPQEGAQITISEIRTEGEESPFQANKDRLLIPNVSDAKPTAGKRVRYRLSDDSELYGVLYLPIDWRKGESYPLIVEFPGNIFYTEKCYSTGLPEQCTIGYGVSKGKGVILLSLPFVDYKKGAIAPSGWGRADDTAHYTVEMVESICSKYGADPKRIMLTGFSRGAIACGFIGLRNDRIASLWSAIHCCQHFDGDGWGKATYSDAVQRLQRGLNIPQFHTDNDSPKLKEMLSSADIDVQYVDSGLGAHACDMFLDDRASTQKLRKWFWTTLGE